MKHEACIFLKLSPATGYWWCSVRSWINPLTRILPEIQNLDRKCTCDKVRRAALKAQLEEENADG